jgi:hypothetical protein
MQVRKMSDFHVASLNEKSFQGSEPETASWMARQTEARSKNFS